MMDAIFKSKIFIESLYTEETPFKWLYTKPFDSYGNEQNRMEMHILEGEPPGGVIIANYKLCTVIALDMDMRQRMVTRVL